MLKCHAKLTATLILASSFLVACSNNSPSESAPKSKPAKVSAASDTGFLRDNYNLLQPATSPSGQPVMRWINPKLKNADYDRILIDEPVMTNAPNDAANKALVTDIKSTIQKDIGIKLQGIFGITTVTKPRTLRLRTAVSAIDAKKVVSPVAIPVDLLQSKDKPALTISKDVILFVEYELTDATSGELMGVGIRRNDSKALPQDLKNISLAQIAPIIDSWAHDSRLFFKKK